MGIINNDNQDVVAFGYLFEKIILFATDLGIQTCWLGGTFKREDFLLRINLQDNEYITIVSPVGYKKGKLRIFESAMRSVVGANNRKPWRIIRDDNLYHFYLCRTKGYGVANYDIQKNDIGIAMCHFELTANELGLDGNWQEIKNINLPDEWEYVITWSAIM
ncbi:nitroreductase family protein [Sedimentibacter sp. MB31-C6]|uniref:nitroreductase family protein n=1 Tax=Sedimentibacter sp. MB31-C6 TaxID=3109366 RepID=UPI002DDD9AE1|nr:nitroreductase family protein [Sedimentibacter sp. MB36-C1]WSI03670.1 nitroreductase family protein [Sedimentibacter sp. MB36-C1]